MKEEHASNLLEMGVDLGIFTIVNLMLEDGVGFDRKSLQELSDHCAKHIEDTCGMPAEDFALQVKPVIDQVIKQVKGK